MNQEREIPKFAGIADPRCMKKVIFTTTLNAIRAKGPCESGWKKLLAHLGKTKADNEPLNLLTILESNGVQDMLWALQAVEHPALEKIARLMAADFAEDFLHIYEKEYPRDDRPRKAIKAARDYTDGKITERELAAARVAAQDSAWDARAATLATGSAARAVAWAAGVATWASVWVTGAAARTARDEQARIIRKYLAKTKATI